MKFQLKTLKKLSGDEATIYSVLILGDKLTLFDTFMADNLVNHKKEVMNIFYRLIAIGNKTGAKENFFRLNEGVPGDGVCAFYDIPKSKLRLYCVRYGNDFLILGCGGPKSKIIKAWQEDPKLNEEAQLVIKIAKIVNDKIKDKDSNFKWSPDHKKFQGDFNFTDDE